MDLPCRCGIMCAIPVGFFFLLGIGELGQLKWNQLRLSQDRDGDAIVHMALAKRKTDQYNEGEIKILNAVNGELRHARMLSRWINHQKSEPMGRHVFQPHLRSRVACVPRLAGTACGLEGSLFAPHSLRIGSASEMFATGYDVEVIKRWGAWAPPHFPSIHMERSIHHVNDRPMDLGLNE